MGIKSSFDEKGVDAVTKKDFQRMQERLAVVERRLDAMMPPSAPRPVETGPANFILKLVAETFGRDIIELIGRSRIEWIVWPRQVAMFLMWEHIGWSSTRIGDFFGRDHSTVMHASKVVKDRASVDKQVELLIKKLSDEVENQKNGAKLEASQ